MPCFLLAAGAFQEKLLNGLSNEQPNKYSPKSFHELSNGDSSSSRFSSGTTEQTGSKKRVRRITLLVEFLKNN